jgi:hypothetical protein
MHFGGSLPQNPVLPVFACKNVFYKPESIKRRSKIIKLKTGEVILIFPFYTFRLFRFYTVPGSYYYGFLRLPLYSDSLPSAFI